MGSTGKAVVLQAAPLELCTKSQVCQTEILRCAGIYPCSCRVPLRHGYCCLRTFLQLFSAVIFVCNTSRFIHGVSKELPLPFCPRHGSERGDWSWLDISGLNPCPLPQCDILVVPQPRPATCQQRELALCCSTRIVEIISCFLIPASEWLQAQTPAWGVEAASGINGQHRKFLDINHVIFPVIREQDEKPRQMALSGVKPAGVALRMQHWVPKVILFHPQL